MKSALCCFFLNLLFCSTDQYQIADFSIKALDPFMEIGLFIISTTDQDRRRFIAWIPLIAASGFVPLESL